MSNPLLLAELTRLIENEELRHAALKAVVHLDSGSEETVDARRAKLHDRELQEEEFEYLWNHYIEPAGADSLNTDEVSPPILTHRMSYQGVAIDNVIRLFAAGGIWWERTKQLVRLVPA